MKKIAIYEITLNEETNEIILKSDSPDRDYSFKNNRGVAELIANFVEDDVNEALRYA
jgi:hypothetical protein